MPPAAVNKDILTSLGTQTQCASRQVGHIQWSGQVFEAPNR